MTKTADRRLSRSSSDRERVSAAVQTEVAEKLKNIRSRFLV